MQWDLTSPHHTSIIEILLLSYIFSTRSLPPFPIKKYQHNDYARAKVWLLKDLNPTQDFQNCHAGDLLSGFVRITTGALKCALHTLGSNFSLVIVSQMFAPYPVMVIEVREQVIKLVQHSLHRIWLTNFVTSIFPIKKFSHLPFHMQ